MYMCYQVYVQEVHVYKCIHTYIVPPLPAAQVPLTTSVHIQTVVHVHACVYHSHISRRFTKIAR